MANEIPSPKEKGFLSKLWKAHSTVAPFVGLFGIPAMYAFLPKAVVLAKAADPGAGLLDMVFTLWGMMGKTLVEFAAPGGSIILGEIGHMAMTAFNTVSHAAAITPAAIPIPAPG